MCQNFFICWLERLHDLYTRTTKDFVKSADSHWKALFREMSLTEPAVLFKRAAEFQLLSSFLKHSNPETVIKMEVFLLKLLLLALQKNVVKAMFYLASEN